MAERNNILEIRDVCKRFQINNDSLQVLDHVSFDVKEGEFISIVGSSGCGKSTLLKLIVALENITSGQILLDGLPVTEPSEKCSMIFQEARLFPWLSVEKNIAFTLNKKMDKAERAKLVQEHIALVGLNGFEKAVPSQLSGGMQQRVSIARGLATKPELLLLDEPFGALDAFTRMDMQKEVLRIREHEKVTMLMVTHDIDEAIYLSDRVVILGSCPGHVNDIVKIDLPHPRERSSMNFLQYRMRIMRSLYDNEKQRDIEYYI